MRKSVRRGQSIVEYVLILSLMACIILGTAVAIGAAVRGNLQKSAHATR